MILRPKLDSGLVPWVRIEHVIYVAFVVLMFCVTPVVNVDVNTIKFNKERSAQCGVNIPLPQKSGYATLINDFDGKTAMVPVWWYMRPALRETAASDVPFFLSPAMMSAGCQSCKSMFFVP